MAEPDFAGAVLRARGNAPFLANLLDREPNLAASLEAGALPDFSTFAEQDTSVPSALRLERRRIALVVAIADLAGAYDLTAVTQALTCFADRALDTAIRTAIAERTPDAEPIGFAALALGKQGSFELNYSSDIDPILIYDPATLPTRPREEVSQAAVRIAKRVVEILQARDGDGYVLRVDLRLRPSPEVTPLAIPVNAAIAYYESQALAWERAAFIRARACAGDVALGQRFLDAVRPFVWRRSLDFGAVGEILDITRRIRDHHAQGQAFGPGYDLKRGRGGIREVEFFAQIHQLVHGGRDVALRAPATRDALARLADAGWIEDADAAALTASYERLRTIEHRVQMIDDRQTHSLPMGDALDRVAQLDGLADGAALLASLAPHVAVTARTYDTLASADDAALSSDPTRLTEQLVTAGFTDAAAGVRRIETWRTGTYPALRSPAAKAALEAVLPAIVAAFASAPDPQVAMLRLDALLERLPNAINIFRLLQARPALAALLAAILSHAEPLAAELGRRADLLDGLIDATALETIGSIGELVTRMRGSEDYQAQLEHVRRIVGETRFALGAQIVAGAADPLDVAEGYARVAEAAIVTLVDATIAEFAKAHGRVPDSEFVILALGRMGGGVLTHASDLDLIYLFTGAFTATSDGDKPLGATLYYNRLAQRVTAALSVPTAAGPLYSIDTRLRPSGVQGPLVVSVDSFARYQREEAWTWEHMALTRGRPVYGSPEARSALESIVANVLGGDRRPHDIAADAARMRADMAAHKPPTGQLDAKLSPGGLVDLEFAVHVVQLTNRTGFDPHLRRAIDALVAQGLLPESMQEAHDVLTRMLVTLRLVAPDAAPPAQATRSLIADALGMADWNAVIASFAATRREVTTVWNRIGEQA